MIDADTSAVEIAVDRADRMWPGCRRVVSTPNGEVVVFAEDDGFHAIANACPHYGVPLDRGMLSHGYVSCPWHNWAINVRTGACLGVRSTVETFPTLVRDGVVHVVVAPLAPAPASASAPVLQPSALPPPALPVGFRPPLTFGE
jgi:nitrite reductase (NADH) small subunit